MRPRSPRWTAVSAPFCPESSDATVRGREGDMTAHCHRQFTWRHRTSCVGVECLEAHHGKGPVRSGEVEPDVGEGAGHRREGPLPFVALEDHRGDRLAAPVPLDLDRPATLQVLEPGGGPVRAAVGGADDRQLVELHVGDENLSHLSAPPPPGAEQQHVVHPEGLDAEADAEVSIGDHVEAGPPARHQLVEPGAPPPPTCQRPVEPDEGTGEIASVAGTFLHGTHPLLVLTRLMPYSTSTCDTA